MDPDEETSGCHDDELTDEEKEAFEATFYEGYGSDEDS